MVSRVCIGFSAVVGYPPILRGACMRGLSVVIPIYNEEPNVAECYTEVRGVLQRMGRPFEILFVDDGSRDRTVETLVQAIAGDPCVRIIQFRRNFGQTAALAAGLDAARQEIVVTLDGDLQNDPKEIPAMVQKLEEGFDLVAGWRKHRKDAFVNRRLPSMIANWIISRTTNVRLHDYGCTLKVMTREVAQSIRLYGEMHRFIPALANDVGARIAEVPVNHRARKAGTSKYGISRTLRVVLDLITVKFLLGFSKRPIHLFGPVGLLSCGLGGVLLAFSIYQRFFENVPMGNRPLFALSVMMVILGIQFFCFGLLAEVLARTYYESQRKSTYVVRRIIDGAASAVGDRPWGQAVGQ